VAPFANGWSMRGNLEYGGDFANRAKALAEAPPIPSCLNGPFPHDHSRIARPSEMETEFRNDPRGPTTLGPIIRRQRGPARSATCLERPAPVRLGSPRSALLRVSGNGVRSAADVMPEIPTPDRLCCRKINKSNLDKPPQNSRASRPSPGNTDTTLCIRSGIRVSQGCGSPVRGGVSWGT
jgi:hypothetical protein